MEQQIVRLYHDLLDEFAHNDIKGQTLITWLMIPQFFYQIFVTAFVLSRKSGYVIMSCVSMPVYICGTILTLMRGWYILTEVGHPEHKFWIKMLPIAGFIGIVYSFIPFIILFFEGFRNWFIDRTVITILMGIQLVLVILWILIFLSAQKIRQMKCPVHSNPQVENIRS